MRVTIPRSVKRLRISVDSEIDDPCREKGSLSAKGQTSRGTNPLFDRVHTGNELREE